MDQCRNCEFSRTKKEHIFSFAMSQNRFALAFNVAQTVIGYRKAYPEYAPPYGKALSA